ncbi:MAG: acylneuraminate cytidylyltransferase family protein [Spirochaetales bacterium]|nr:acylneuraminate cytidylyltransferase family protein [Spirochaetales bacterium]
MGEPTSSCLGLIPARSGSKRIAGKNVRELEGHPLIAYSIGAALDSGVFTRVIVSTDSNEIARIARMYGAEVPFLRPPEFAGDNSPDIEWIGHLLGTLKESGETAEYFSILRPTSPFRTAATIRRAWNEFLEDGFADSLRAVEKCHEHPAKMWRINGARMTPVMINPDLNAVPWHSSPYQTLPEVYVQNASLEIARIDVVLGRGSIAGDSIMPFITDETEGFDINREMDWIIAEYMLSSGHAELPRVRREGNL